MKIAFLTPEYPHPQTGSSGGLGTSIFNLAKGLTALKQEVVILVYGQKQDKIFKTGDATVYQIKNVKLKGLSWWLTRQKIEKLINQLYDDQIIDVLEAPDWTGITSFIKPKQCPIVIRLNGSDTYFCHLENRKVKWKNRFHEKRALQHADAHISVSRFTAEQTNAIFGLDIDFKIIPNSINTESFQPSTAEKIKPKSILYLGTLIRKKGLLDIPHIFNHINQKEPEAELILIGKDASDIKTGQASTWELIKPLFSQKAIKQVFYKGKVPYDEVQNHIQKADACIFPSYAEALSLSWLEAMAMQKAVVASDIGWAEEVIVYGKSGLLAHPGHHQKFAEHVLKLFENPELKNDLEKKAREKIVKEFDYKVIAEKSVEFYMSVIQKSKADGK